MSDRIEEIRARLDALRVTYAGNVPEAMDHPGLGEPGDYFIAHAPADIAWLLDEVDAAHERIALLRAEVDDLDRIRRMYQDVKS